MQIDGSTKTILIDELKCAMAALNGNFELSTVGIRIEKEKHMVTFKDEETGVIQLISKNGGACLGKSRTYMVVGLWSKEAKTSLDQPQNMEFCFKMVLKTIKTLTDVCL